MEKIINNLNVTEDEKRIIFNALIYYLFEYCEYDPFLFTKVDNLIDKYFTEDDFLL